MAIPSFLQGQYLPLDVEEMKFRTGMHVQMPGIGESTIIDTGKGLVASLSTENRGTIFIVPKIFLRLSDNINIRFKAIATNAKYYGPRIGSRYERTGNFVGSKKPGDFSTLHSALNYETQNYFLRLGKLQLQSGNFKNDIRYNNYLPSAHGLRYGFRLKDFAYTHGHHWLGYSSPMDDTIGLSRYLAYQAFAMQTAKFTLEIASTVIYAGTDKPIKIRYFSPMDPFIVELFNLGSPDNDDNYAILLGFVWHTLPQFDIHIRAVIDEFEVDPEDRVINDDDWGMQLLAEYNLDSDLFSQLYLSFIYASDYLGVHYGESINYEVMGLSLFSRFGPQYRRIEFGATLNKPNGSLSSHLQAYYHIGGENDILGTEWQPRYIQSGTNWTSTWGVVIESGWNVRRDMFIYSILDINNIQTIMFQLEVGYTF